MITVDVKGEEEVKKLAKILQVYTRVNKRDRQQLIRKKGIDAGIKLSKGFAKRKWKGGKKIAEREMRKRSKSGRGTRIRERFLNGDTPPERSKTGRRLNWYQKLVWQETRRRQSGIGVLGASFLLRRYRSKSTGRILRRNGPTRISMKKYSRQAGLVSSVKVAPDYFEIAGFFPGHRPVSDRYGIVAQAAREVTADTIPYIQKKTGEQFHDYMRKAGINGF